MDTVGMDKYERRRLRLLELRDTRCNGKAATLARDIGRDASYVTRMLYPAGKAGKKRIADDMIEIIEAAFKLPHGWLDQEPGTSDQKKYFAGAAAIHEDESIRAVIELMEGTSEKTRIEIFGIVRNYLINVTSESGTPQKIIGRTGTHS